MKRHVDRGHIDRNNSSNELSGIENSIDFSVPRVITVGDQKRSNIQKINHNHKLQEISFDSISEFTYTTSDDEMDNNDDVIYRTHKRDTIHHARSVPANLDNASQEPSPKPSSILCRRNLSSMSLDRLKDSYSHCHLQLGHYSRSHNSLPYYVSEVGCKYSIFEISQDSSESSESVLQLGNTNSAHHILPQITLPDYPTNQIHLDQISKKAFPSKFDIVKPNHNQVFNYIVENRRSDLHCSSIAIFPLGKSKGNKNSNHLEESDTKITIRIDNSEKHISNKIANSHTDKIGKIEKSFGKSVVNNFTKSITSNIVVSIAKNLISHSEFGIYQIKPSENSQEEALKYNFDELIDQSVVDNSGNSSNTINCTFIEKDQTVNKIEQFVETTLPEEGTIPIGNLEIEQDKKFNCKIQCSFPTAFEREIVTKNIDILKKDTIYNFDKNNNCLENNQIFNCGNNHLDVLEGNIECIHEKSPISILSCSHSNDKNFNSHYFTDTQMASSGINSPVSLTSTPTGVIDQSTEFETLLYQNNGLCIESDDKQGVTLLQDKSYASMDSETRSILSDSTVQQMTDVRLSSVTLDILSQQSTCVSETKNIDVDRSMLIEKDSSSESSCNAESMGSSEFEEKSDIKNPSIGCFQYLLLQFHPASMKAIKPHELHHYKSVSNARLFTGRNYFFCNYKAVLGPDWLSLSLTWMLVLLSGLVFFGYVTPAFMYTIGWYCFPIAIPQLFFFICTSISLILTSSMDPGIVPKDLKPNKILQKLYEHQNDFVYNLELQGGEHSSTHDPKQENIPESKMEIINGVPVKIKWCRTCQIYRPPRTSHCRKCNNCVRRFDHHCPWMSTCIGERNYRFFYSFLTFALLGIIYGIFICFLHIVGTFLTKLFRDQVNIGTAATFTGISCAVTLLLAAFLCLLLFSVFSLWAFHTYLLLRNMTTNEHINERFKKSKNPYSRGIIYNIYTTLFSKIRKSDLQMRKTVYLDDDASLG